MSSYVICSHTVTGPLASKLYPWMPDNAPCGCKCRVGTVAQVMHFRCPRGHEFYAKPCDILPSPGKAQR